MKRFQASVIGVDQGQALLFSDFEDGGPMWAGNGQRDRRVPVAFSESFRQKPAVTVSLDMWDMDVRSNQRADILVENVTPKGFEIVFKTWGDTRVARARAAWTAIGEVGHEDDWEV